MTVNIYTTFNGVGLEADAHIIKNALPDHHVNIIDWRKGSRGRYNYATLGIHLEHIRREYLRETALSVLIPNPEWFDSMFMRLLKRIDVVLCKSQNGLEIFRQFHPDCRYIGFTSYDRLADVKKKREFVHIGGKSLHKNSRLVAAAWQGLSEKLTLQKLDGNFNGNYTFVRKRIEDMDAFLSSFQFHVCPSKAEGFGHYINEALSVGGIVLTTDAPPMNELVRPEYGIMIPASAAGRHWLAREYEVTADGIRDAVRRCMLLTTQQIEQMSRLSRDVYLKRDAEFKTNLNNFIRCIKT